VTLDAKFLKIEPGTELEARWECLARSNPASGFMQSLHWARCKKMQGFEVLHIGVFEDRKLVGGVLCYVPEGSRSIGMATAPEGPVLNWDDEMQSTQSMSLILNLLRLHAKEFSYMGFHAEPRLAPPLRKLFRNFARAPYDLLPKETLYLSLEQSEELLLQQMKHKGRYNIHLAQKHQVTVTAENSSDGLDVFYELLKVAGDRNEFFVEPYSFFSSIYETLLPAGMLEILVARYKGEPLAAMLLINFGLRATYFYGGVANTDRNVMAGYALQWEAIKRSRLKGALVYDFYGYTESGDPDHLYFSFSKFKRLFGGEPRSFTGAQHHLFVDRLADAVINAARELGMEEVCR
jgi:lipid II:glycine glycyltransferase (peptidoglycan interpeptide bridge formation enzyme)